MCSLNQFAVVCNLVAMSCCCFHCSLLLLLLLWLCGQLVLWHAVLCSLLELQLLLWPCGQLVLQESVMRVVVDVSWCGVDVVLW